MERRFFLNGFTCLVMAVVCAATYLLPTMQSILNSVSKAFLLVACLANLLVFWRNTRVGLFELDDRLKRTGHRYFIRRL